MIRRRSTLRSPQRAKEKREQLLLRLYVGAGAFVLFVVGLAFLSHAPFMSIKHIDIEGNEVITHDELAQYVEEHIAGNYLWVFSKKNILLYPRRTIERGILRDFSRTQNADVFFKNMTTIGVRVEERKPFAVWCDSVAYNDVPTFSDDCYLMNEHGLIFATAPQFSGAIYITYYGNISAKDPIGQTYMQESDLLAVHGFVESVHELGFAVDKVYVHDDGDIDVYTKHGGKIFVSLRTSLDAALEHLGSLMSDRTTIPDTQVFFETLDYIDLRFGKKIFFKLL